MATWHSDKQHKLQVRGGGGVDKSAHVLEIGENPEGYWTNKLFNSYWVVRSRAKFTYSRPRVCADILC